MIRARTRHELPCSPERFWELYLDVAFIQRAFVEGLRWAPPKIVAVTDDGRIYKRVMEATPNLVLPGPVAKLVNRTLGFTETGTFDRETQRFKRLDRLGDGGPPRRDDGASPGVSPT